MKLLIVTYALLCMNRAAQIPSSFKKCNRKQDDLKQCVFDAAKEAIPQLDRPYNEINLPNLDPLFIKQQSAKAQILILKYTEHLYNCSYYGFTSGDLKKFTWDLDNKQIDVDILIPNFKSVCVHKVDGVLLVLPVTTSGPSKISYKNFDAKYRITYKESLRNGMTYVDIVDSGFYAKISDIHFQLDDLNVKGHKILGKLLNVFINATWRLFYDQIKGGYFEMVNLKLRKLCQDFFDVVSIEVAFD